VRPILKFRVVSFTLLTVFLVGGFWTCLSAPLPQTGAAVTVKMTADHMFDPDKVTIKVGDSVEWINTEDSGLHQVTNDPKFASDPDDVSGPDGSQPFNSKSITGGKSYIQKFTVPGVYKYTCPPHEMDGMNGQVTVTQ